MSKIPLQGLEKEQELKDFAQVGALGTGEVAYACSNLDGKRTVYFVAKKGILFYHIHKIGDLLSEFGAHDFEANVVEVAAAKLEEEEKKEKDGESKIEGEEKEESKTEAIEVTIEQ